MITVMEAHYSHWITMTKNTFGEMIFDEDDLLNLVMQDQLGSMSYPMLVEPAVALHQDLLEHNYNFEPYQQQDCSVEEFDRENQRNWFMPEEYKQLDIAEHVLKLCATPEQLQRVGHELLLFQERNLFDLLRYLKYLVDTMTENRIIWGVGRGSSVASYVLYLLGVHRVDSMYYDLDPEEFLR